MLAKKLESAAKAVEPVYIEDVFSTWLYTGNGSTQTITNGIDLAGDGGLVWIKNRSASASNNLYDTNRGTDLALQTNSTAAQVSTATYGVDQFLNTGFVVGGSSNNKWSNYSGDNYASWTFRKAPKFFDVVTYTGNGANRTIAHNLGSVPGCIIVKRTDAIADWQVYHRSLANTEYLVLNSTAAKATGTTRWNSTTPTSTVFSVGTDTTVNANGGTYVAYLFAHDAGGFGLTGTDNVISCGSFTTDGSGNATVNLGYEPQWLLIKQTNVGGASWMIHDVMRGMSLTTYAELNPNTSAAESSGASEYIVPQSSGFKAVISQNNTFIYIAIRRGPMKTPTSGTSVFSPNAVNAALDTKVSTNFPIDLQIVKFQRDSGTVANTAFDRLRGVSSNSTEVSRFLSTNATSAETTNTTSTTRGFDNTGFRVQDWYANTSSIYWNFRRAPGFFDVVCYTGTGSARTVAHNLGVVPELMIVKGRSSSSTWGVWNKDIFAANPASVLALQLAQAVSTGASTYFNSTAPTSSVFTVGTADATNGSSVNFVAYLFASCPGVSKVGSYTGTGTTKQIDCGFTGGARFVLIKRTDSAGDWYVWDSARGIVAGNDPYLLLNSTAAEVTNTDYVDTYAQGFEISSTAPAAINANGGTFIFLAIA